MPIRRLNTAPTEMTKNTKIQKSAYAMKYMPIKMHTPIANHIPNHVPINMTHNTNTDIPKGFPMCNDAAKNTTARTVAIIIAIAFITPII